MSSVGRTMSGAAGRLLGRARDEHDDYAFCPEDRFWFRPAYTEGTCPLCGEVAPGGVTAPPRWIAMDRSWFGMAALAVESLAMLALVMFMYFRG